MTTGYSGSFGVNGINFVLQPSESGWSGRENLGIDGTAHPVYAAYREYNLSWGLAHPADVKQLIDAYNQMGNTGTLSFDLPQWGAAGYLFQSYSGCTMQEPEIGSYFNEYITDVKVVILKVRT